MKERAGQPSSWLGLNKSTLDPTLPPVPASLAHVLAKNHDFWEPSKAGLGLGPGLQAPRLVCNSAPLQGQLSEAQVSDKVQLMLLIWEEGRWNKTTRQPGKN